MSESVNKIQAKKSLGQEWLRLLRERYTLEIFSMVE